jgi:hypothetical protein
MPSLKASIRLLRHIFSTTTNIPEFQRQLAIPSVPKFTDALTAIVQKHTEPELQVHHLVLFTLFLSQTILGAQSQNNHEATSALPNSSSPLTCLLVGARTAIPQWLCATSY